MTDKEGVFIGLLEGRGPMPPSSKLLGWKLIDLDAEQGTIEIEYEAKPEFLNPIGTIQGGFLAAMLDDTVAPALIITLGPGHAVPTVEMKINFIRPAKVGKLIGRGKVVHKGRSIAFLEGSLWTPEGDLIATATVTALIKRL